MKILITYFSQTGNTEKVAISMKEALTNEEVDLLPVKNVDPTNLSTYDLIFLGSGVYASRAHNSVVNLIKNAPDLPPKFAFFCTHQSLDFYQKPFIKINKIFEKNNCKLLGTFDCVGENLGIPKETQIAMLNRLPEEQRKKAEEDWKKSKDRPNNDDLENAKKFTQSIIKLL
ncbi:MAG: flavodoxin family protein [Promethearchaeota archaeon]